MSLKAHNKGASVADVYKAHNKGASVADVSLNSQ